MKALFLGTGGSMGTPVIGCKCPVCLSTDPQNQRLRASILLEEEKRKFLIDVSPDIRSVCLKFDIDRLDGIFLTHYHEDHIGGLNDLRPHFFHRKKKPIPLFLSQNTYDQVLSRFSYLMDRFAPVLLKGERGDEEGDNFPFSYFTYFQEGVPVTGYRMGKFAYVTDIKEFKEEIYKELEGVETLVISALNEVGSLMHFSVEEAVRFAQKAHVHKCYLTHISHEMEHNRLREALPSWIQPAYDGLTIDV